MKKKLLILFFSLNLISLTSISSAQNYTPFPDSNAVWVTGLYGVDWGGPIPEYVLYTTENFCITNADTIISTVSYSKIFICGGAYHGALRDNGGQVYFIPSGTATELLLYDFTALPGETIYDVYAGNISDYIVSNIDSVLIGGTYRTIINLSTGSWIEGIGCTHGLFNDPYDDLDGMEDLLCMSVNDTVYYPNYGAGACALDLGVDNQNNFQSTISIFPNPTSGIVEVWFDVSDPINHIYVTNALGQTISVQIEKSQNLFKIDISNQPPGIYLVHLVTTNGENLVQKIIRE